MKKLIAVCLIAMTLSGCVYAGSEAHNIPTGIPEPTISADQLVGKTLDELGDVIVVDVQLLAYGYGFCTDKVGNPIAFEWELNEQDQFVVTYAEVFAAKNVDNSPEAFEQMEKGMTIYEAVEKVGMPSSIPTTGLFYIEFLDSEGNAYWLNWQGDPITYQFVVKREKETD